MKIIDISMEIHSDMLFYPGDSTFSIKRINSMPKDVINLSEITMGVHTGTHVDAPLHFLPEAATITAFDLSTFYGKAQVLDFTSLDFGQEITAKDLKSKLVEKNDIVLLKTKNSSLEPDTEFREDSVQLSLDGAEFLVEREIKSVGIDYLTIGGQKAHKTLLGNNIVVIEGLRLGHVSYGQYIYVGFPLKIREAEGVPIRAVLLETDD